MLALWISMRLVDVDGRRRPSGAAPPTAAVTQAHGSGSAHRLTRAEAPLLAETPHRASPWPVSAVSSHTSRKAGERVAVRIADRTMKSSSGRPALDDRGGAIGRDVAPVALAEPMTADPASRIVLMPAPFILTPYRLPPVAAARWSGSAWLVVRDGASLGLANGQLGASQAGVRITYALTGTRRLAAAARVSAPRTGVGRELAVGLDWQPTRAPVHVIAEERVALDEGTSGPMIGVIGGFGPAAIAGRWTAEAYAQAGGVARRGGGLFADGAIRVTRPLARTGRRAIDAGVGAWGGMQPGVSRLDVGPSVGLALPVGGHALRLAVDWRQRVGGAASPASGLAISLGGNL
ncbi:hypothetical protein [Sphingomonas kyungheensis]|uniref:Haemolysin activator HlyB C-terminal domain-containing protein n=1 Tax=Sphingomonas kyungheensis TaxID=1069987 RepID=A0ABU8H415_9SPHN